MLLQVSLELGGKSPHLIFESADLEQGMTLIRTSLNAASFVTFLKYIGHLASTFPNSLLLMVVAAASWAALGICYNTGQDCTAGSRVYVQEPIYDRFIDLLTAKVKATIMGDGFDEISTGGPIVSCGAFPCRNSDLNACFRFLKGNMTVYGHISKQASKRELSQYLAGSNEPVKASLLIRQVGVRKIYCSRRSRSLPLAVFTDIHRDMKIVWPFTTL